MSIRVVFQDGSSEKLLDDKLTEAGDEDEDESLASLLGITEKDVVNLDDDDAEKADGESPSTESGESQTEKDEENENTSEKEDDNPAESATDVTEIEPDVCENGEDTAVEIPSDNDDSSEKEEKKHSPLDFKKLFEFDRDTSPGTQEPQPGTSDADRVHIQLEDENGNENDSEKAKLITPPEPSKTGSFRPIPAVILDRRNVERSLMRKEMAQRGKLICGIVMVILLLCMSLGLLAAGWWFGMEDLYIIGGIFGGGAVIFFVIFVFIRCTTNIPSEYRTLYKIESPEKNV